MRLKNVGASTEKDLIKYIQHFIPEEEDKELSDDWPALKPKNWRYAGRFTHHYIMRSNILSQSFTFLRQFLNQQLIPIMDKIVKRIEELEMGDLQFIEFGKSLTTYIKNSKLDKQYYVFVDMHTFLGQAKKTTAQKSQELLFEEVKEWVSESWYTQGPYLDAFEQYFDETAVELIPTMFSNPEGFPPLTKDRILDNPWIVGSNGSANNSPAYIRKRLSRYPSQMRSKWLFVNTATRREMEKLIFEGYKSRPKAFAKPDEVVKLRAIVTSDLALHCKMAVIQYYMSKTMASSLRQYSPIFAGNKWTQEMFREVWDLQRRGSIPASLDESHFDFHASKNMISSIIRAIRKGIDKTARDGERETLLYIVDLIYKDIFPEKVIVGDKEVKYKSGVLSGWNWTAIMDTLLNLVKQMSIIEMLADLGLISGRPVRNYALGDDILQILKAKRDIDPIVALYNEIGFEVNPAKFSVGDNAEFLRKFLVFKTKTKYPQILGYPARMVHSILFRMDNKILPKDLRERIQQLASNWLQFSQRISGLNYANGTEGIDINTIVIPHLVRDIHYATRLSMGTVEKLLKTPSLAGGFGFIYDGVNYEGLVLKEDKDKFTSYEKKDLYQRLNQDLNTFGKDYGDPVSFFPDMNIIERKYLIKRWKTTRSNIRMDYILPLNIKSIDPPRANETWFGGDNPLWFKKMSRELSVLLRTRGPLNKYFREQDIQTIHRLENKMSRRLLIECLLGSLPNLGLNSLRYNVKESYGLDEMNIVYSFVNKYTTGMRKLSLNFVVSVLLKWETITWGWQPYVLLFS